MCDTHFCAFQAMHLMHYQNPDVYFTTIITFELYTEQNFCGNFERIFFLIVGKGSKNITQQLLVDIMKKFITDFHRDCGALVVVLLRSKLSLPKTKVSNNIQLYIL